MSDQRWSEETAADIALAIHAVACNCGSVVSVDREKAEQLLAYLADAGLLAASSTSDSPRVDVEWLGRDPVHELRTAITAIRNAVFGGRHDSAMSMLAALRDRIGVYERAEDATAEVQP